MSVTALKNALHDLGIDVRLLQQLAPLTDVSAPSDVPTATTTTPGTVLQAAAFNDIGAAPSQANFNQLLQNLRDAGIMDPQQF